MDHDLCSAISVVTVCVLLIGTFTCRGVHALAIGGSIICSITYSTDQSNWTTTLSLASVGDSWYSKINIDGGQYSGTFVEITWQLQRKTSDTTWDDVGTSTLTTITLGASSQDVYATDTGVSTGNRDWGLDVAEQGTYRVIVTINSS